MSDREDINQRIRRLSAEAELRRQHYATLAERARRELADVLREMNQIRAKVPEAHLLGPLTLREGQPPSEHYEAEWDSDHRPGLWDPILRWVTYNPETGKFRHTYPSPNYTKTELVEAYKSQLATWVVRDYPYERAKHDEQTSREAAQRAWEQTCKNKEEARAIRQWGCALIVVLVIGISITSCVVDVLY